ncbi:anti-sigma factor antagonist [Streptomyces lasalocidi]
MQTYRITGDPRIKEDADATLRLFDRFYLDPEEGGYFSHIDPILLSPHHASLGPNQARKNWNSVGDHAPAYLINLYLATGEQKYADMLEYTFDTIVERFPDLKSSPFVQERFHKDWAHDTSHGWQQNRAVVGHNLKIAWNLMRMHALRPKDVYLQTAVSLGETMPEVGSDRQRGGWYDVLERVKVDGEERFRFAWHDRKAWWQQEQAILAYLILHGVTGRLDFRSEARDAQSFYNAFFLDHDEGAVYFNTMASGLPYLLGVERLKGSHSMSMYHSAELCYLAAVYNNLLVHGKPMDFWFKPDPALLEGRVLRVAPDLLPSRDGAHRVRGGRRRGAHRLQRAGPDRPAARDLGTGQGEGPAPAQLPYRGEGMSVKVSSQVLTEATVVALEGEINSTTSGGLQSQLLPLIGHSSVVLIDLTGVSYISSAGLRTLLIVHRHAQQLKAEITLVGLSEEVSFVMSATGFLDFFRIAEDLDAELERAGR